MSHKKNILIISPFFFPEPISTGKFNTDLAIKLAQLGHNVSVLCFHPFYPDWKIESTKKELEKIKIIRGGRLVYFSNINILRRLILEISFAFFILRNFFKLRQNEIVIPVFPPSFGFFLGLLFFKKDTRKVGMVHDLQEIYSTEKQGYLYKVVSKIIHYIEKKCLNNCNKLVFLSSEMMNEAKKLYGLANVTLEIQYPFYNIVDKKTNELDLIFDNKKNNIVYSGALGEKQNPEKLYNFFNYASHRIENSVFYIFSKGSIYDKLKKNNSNPNIKFYNLVKKDCVFELYTKSDVQVLPQKENTSKGSLPSKLPNLLFSGCKVFTITDNGSEIDKLFTSRDIGEVATKWDNSILTKKLAFYLSEELNSNSQKLVAKELFSIDLMILKILN